MNKRIYIGVYGIIINEGKILFIKKSRGPYKGMYDLPGGGVEYGESFEETLKREFIEETGLEINSLKFIQNNYLTIEYKDDAGEEKGLHHVGIYYFVDVKMSNNIKTNADGEDSLGAEYIGIEDILNIDISPISELVIKNFLNIK